MGHLHKIDCLRFSGNVFAHDNGDFHFLIVLKLPFDNFPERDDVAFRVGNFDAYRVLAGNRRHNTHRGRGKAQGDVVLQADNF